MVASSDAVMSKLNWVEYSPWNMARPRKWCGNVDYDDYQRPQVVFSCS